MNKKIRPFKRSCPFICPVKIKWTKMNRNSFVFVRFVYSPSLTGIKWNINYKLDGPKVKLVYIQRNSASGEHIRNWYWRETNSISLSKPPGLFLGGWLLGQTLLLMFCWCWPSWTSWRKWRGKQVIHFVIKGIHYKNSFRSLKGSTNQSFMCKIFDAVLWRYDCFFQKQVGLPVKARAVGLWHVALAGVLSCKR